jgi:hypothetical protein
MSVKDARERRQCQGFQELRVIGNHTRRQENEGFSCSCTCAFFGWRLALNLGHKHSYENNVNIFVNHDGLFDD